MINQIRILFLLLNCLAVSKALQGVKLPSTSTSSKVSQRSAIAIQSRSYAGQTTVPFPNEVQQEFSSISVFVPEQLQQQQPLVEPKDSSSSSSLTRELFGEAFGTFWIVGIGSIAGMSATFADPFTATPLPEVALVWSLAVASAISFCTNAKWSDAHFNPAMTLASALFRGFDWNKVLPYSLAQMLGSTAGSGLAYSGFHKAIRQYEEHQGLVRSCSIETARVFGEYFDNSLLSAAQAFGIEALGTAILAATAFAMTHPSQNQQQSLPPLPLVMGGTVFSLINWLAPYTQAGMNPARDFGPRIFAYLAGWTDVAFEGCPVYLLGPLVGATVGAGLVDKVLFQNQDQR